MPDEQERLNDLMREITEIKLSLVRLTALIEQISLGLGIDITKY